MCILLLLERVYWLLFVFLLLCGRIILKNINEFSISEKTVAIKLNDKDNEFGFYKG